jgi:hypothetical protein
MLCLIILSSSCASWAIPLVPRLEQRTLFLSSEIAGFFYDYEVCAKKFLGICVKKEIKRDLYDLNDPAVRKQLIDMGFVAYVEKVN